MLDNLKWNWTMSLSHNVNGEWLLLKIIIPLDDSFANVLCSFIKNIFLFFLNLKLCPIIYYPLKHFIEKKVKIDKKTNQFIRQLDTFILADQVETVVYSFFVSISWFFTWIKTWYPGSPTQIKLDSSRQALKEPETSQNLLDFMWSQSRSCKTISRLL